MANNCDYDYITPDLQPQRTTYVNENNSNNSERGCIDYGYESNDSDCENLYQFEEPLNVSDECQQLVQQSTHHHIDNNLQQTGKGNNRQIIVQVRKTGSIEDEGIRRTSDSQDYNPSGNNNMFASISKKRKYKYLNRTKRSDSHSKMRKRWKQTSSNITMSDLKNMSCCKKLSCFQVASAPYLKSKIDTYISTSSIERRQLLCSFLSSNGSFHFDGNQVCTTFLLIAFRFSRDLQSAVRRSPNLLRCNITDRAARSRERIIVILNRIADATDKMPNRNHTILPFFRKKDVFSTFKSDYAQLYADDSFSTPSESYFYRVWSKDCCHIKVRKHSKFTECTVCEELRAALEEALTSRQDTKDILYRKQAHNIMISNERMEYTRKRNNAIRTPSSYCSIILDGADQSAFGLPHFTTTTKQVTGIALKVKLIGVLEHAVKNKLLLLTMTEEHETGANHIVESIHRFLNDRIQTSSLPPVLYIQMDNCGRENKNRYLFSYVESLVSWGVFDEIECSFLPVGHTHEDIDQCFSRTSDKLRHNIAITLSELHAALKETYNDKTVVSHMKHLINWSELTENSSCLRNVKNFSQLRYFRFICHNQSSPDSTPSPRLSRRGFTSRRTTCFVKFNAPDEWKPLFSSGVNNSFGFLRDTPDLSVTPTTKITCPVGLDKFNKRLQSEEGRINSTCKLRELHSLRDHIFRSRSEKFHWNLQLSVENTLYRTNLESNRAAGHHSNNQQHGNYNEHSSQLHDQSSTINITAHQTSQSNPCYVVRSDFEYARNEFVAALPPSDDACPFWVAQVKKVNKNMDGIVSSLLIQWYELNESTDIYGGMYIRSCHRSSRRNGKSKPWTDEIEADSVIVTFSSLMTNSVLPQSVQKHLRAIATSHGK